VEQGVTVGGPSRVGQEPHAGAQGIEPFAFGYIGFESDGFDGQMSPASMQAAVRQCPAR
jgi:hypothetical protein